MQRRKEAVRQLTAAGADQHALNGQTDLMADLIITDKEEPQGIRCIPVLRPDNGGDKLCCATVPEALSDSDFLVVLEAWKDIREAAGKLGLENEPVVDHVTIGSLERLAGPEVLRIGRQKFLNSAEKYLRRMEKGKNTLNLEEVTKVLHTLKGSSGTIGARQICLASKQIEESVENGFDEAVLSNQLSLLKMLLEYFRFQSKEWGKTSTNGEKNFNG